MSKRLRCEKGHTWDLPAQDKIDSCLAGDICPFCGSAAETIPPPGSTADQGSGAGQGTPKESLPEIPGYDIIEELGRGGMGIVYRARQVALNRIVALKMLKAGAEAKVEEIERFKAEARTTAGLDHPGIVQVHDVGQYEGRAYFSMEFVEGGGLDQRLKSGPLTASVAALLVEEAALAVHYSHINLNTIHRDLKPSNILLAAAKTQAAGVDGMGRNAEDSGKDAPSLGAADLGWSPKITDFGLAKRLNETGISQIGQIMGTPSYMAPEQASADACIGPAADVYALGAILYECLTGRPPFSAPSVLETLEQVRTKEPVAIRRLQPRVPSDLETICHKCLRKEPANRYASALALAEDLQRFAKCEPIRARPVGILEQGIKWTKRRPSQAALAGLLGVVVLCAFAGSLWLAHAKRLRQLRTRQEVNRALQEAAELRGKAEAFGQDAAVWDAAVASARRAQAALESGEPDEEMPLRVRTALVQLEAGRDSARKAAQESLTDRRLVERLAAIRAQRLTPRRGSIPYGWATSCYKEAFAEYGFEIRKGTVVEAANRLRPSVRLEEAAALDDWALVCATQGAVWDTLWLLGVSKVLDPDPWRNKVRSVLVGFNAKALKRLAEESRSQRLPAATLILLAGGLMRTHQAEEAVACLAYAQQQSFQDDFFINELLGELYSIYVNPPQPEKAIRYLMAAVAIQKGNPVGHTGLGVALQMTGQLEDAVKCHRRAIELDPKLALAHSNLSWALMELGKVDEAIDSCRKAIELDPKMAAAYTNLGIGLMAKGRLDEALTACRKAVELDRSLALAHNNLGLALRRTGHPDEAISCYRKAIELDPKQPEPHNNISIILKERRKLDEALRSCRKAIELDPRYAPAYSNLGAVLAEMGHNQEAISACRKAIDLAPRHAEPYANMGVALLHEGEKQDALACFRKAIELDPKLAVAHSNLGVLLLAEGKVAEAIACHRKAIEADPRSALAYRNLSAALAAKREYGEAQASARKAIELDPMHAMGYLNLGAAFANSGRLDEAFPLYLKAIELDPKLASAHKNLGLTYRSKGKFSEAAASLRTAERLFGNEKNSTEAALVAKWVYECEKVVALQPKLAAFLRGEFQPKDNGERVALIYLCQEKQLHRAAARLYAELFAADPKIADDLKTGYRYDSACSAALAATGQSEDASGLNDQERSELRKQALAWLRANLNLWTERLRNGNAVDRNTVKRHMRHWLEDPDLAALRDARSLEKLPKKEREDWQQFWRDVDVLLRRSQ